MSDPIIKVDKISKCYHLDSLHQSSFRNDIVEKLKGLAGGNRNNQERKKYWALKDISFEMTSGESLGIIGRNGAGKSTLLKIISEIIEPTDGTIELNGSVASVLDIGSGLLPDLTGLENIHSYCRLLGFSKERITEIFDSIVEFSELESFLYTPVKYYSTGMMMRLAFSVIVHLDDDIMLFDEILAVGDLSFRNKCFERINELKNNGKTFILVSHSLSEVANYCDRIILLEAGKIAAYGRLVDIVNMYYKLNVGKDFTKSSDRGSRDFKMKGMLAERIYNETIQALTPEKIWEEKNMPGDNNVRFKRVSVKDGSGHNSGLIDISSPVNIELELIRSDSSEHPEISISVSDMMDNRLFMDFSGSNRHKKTGKYESGNYLFTWVIPPDILNKGIFKVSFYILDNNLLPTFRLINAVNFEIHEEKSDVEGFEFYTAIRPKLDFTSQKTE